MLKGVAVSSTRTEVEALHGLDDVLGKFVTLANRDDDRLKLSVMLLTDSRPPVAQPRRGSGEIGAGVPKRLLE